MEERLKKEEVEKQLQELKYCIVGTQRILRTTKAQIKNLKERLRNQRVVRDELRIELKDMKYELLGVEAMLDKFEEYGEEVK